jgi:hypothetical protein
VVTQLPHGGLTSVEQSLVEHVGRGDWLDLAAEDEAVDEAAMRSWGKSRTCRATVIRDILRGRLAADPDPHGLRLRGARITGRLYLENLSTDVNLELKDCLLEEGILAQGARLAFVGLAGCWLEHPAEPPVAADRLTCSVLALTGATITGHTGAGAVRLRGGAVRLTGAHIGGSLECDGASLHDDSGPALLADGLQVGQDIFLREGFTATGGGADGAVRLTGAHIGGSLICDGASLRNDSGPALVAYGLQVGRSVFLRRGFTAIGVGERGAVRLVSAHIGGSLDCTGAELRNDSGSALLADVLQVDQDVECDRITADGGVVIGGHIGRLLSLEGAALNNPAGIALSSDGLRVDGTMFCRNGFTAQGEVRLPGAQIGGRLYFDGAKLSNPGGHALVASRLTVGQDMFCRNQGGPGHEQPFVTEGMVILNGAHIGGHLDCSGAQLRNDSGPALVADSLHVDQDMVLRDGFTATGSGDDGAIGLAGAHIGGHLYCTGANLRNDSGPALDAYSLQVGLGMHLFGGFTATASSALGAVNLTGAHIGARLLCDGASLRNDSGPALAAYGGLQVGQGVFLRRGFTATGADKSGAVCLIGAHIGGQLDCTGADLRNDSGPALVADGVQAGRDMYLSDGFTATGGSEEVAVDLGDAQVGGTLVFDPAGLEHAAGAHRRLKVDGLTYAGVPSGSRPGGWLDLLRAGTPAYAAQPYQQLAAGYRALGDDRQARQTLMAQRNDQLARTHPRWPERWWGWITKVTLGYGYQPWRALWFLAGVVVVSCVLAVGLGAHGALAQTKNTAAPSQPCTVIQQVSVGLDLNLPVGTSVARASCDLTKDSASTTGAWLTALGWVLRVLAWVFAALFIAGFTSAVRKT